MKQIYRQEEAQEILRRALSQPAPDAGFSHEQLREMAAELGIDPTALDTAAREWRIERQEAAERREYIAARRREYVSHLLPFLMVGTGLVLTNLATEGSITWSLFPLLGWGIPTLLHGRGALSTRGEAFERAFQKWREERRTGPSGNAEAKA